MKGKRLIVYIVFLALVVGGLVWLLTRKGKSYHVNQGVVWTTEYHITYEASCDLNDSIQDVFKVIDESASAFNKNSLVSRVNSNATSTVDDIFVKLYRASCQVHAASDSLFDPTVMPLVNAWGFGYKSGELPTEAQIDSILVFVGLQKTSLEGYTLNKDDPRTQFDFSSIAKGLACDEVAHMLERNGATNYIVEIGGEVVAKGVNERGEKWRVAIDLPSDESDGQVRHEAATTLGMESGAVATSGSYRKFVESGGERRSHIVNPITGSAATSDLLSVTIVAPDCMTADAWATACMAMGTSRTQSLMEKNADLGVMTISATDDGQMVVWSNAAFAARINK
ncbi:MAG: FAD:protein FMN transferase [Muribaculaceae bacterium]|nr:FAD:protein FMN transferase [Muribaculaceae bacterium]